MTLRQDLHVQQGTTWSHQHTVLDDDGTAVDLSGCTAQVDVRDRPDGTLFARLSTEDGTITLGADGVVVMSMTAATTSLLLTKVLFASYEQMPSRPPLRYDLKINFTDGTVTRELQGHFTVSEEVTS